MLQISLQENIEGIVWPRWRNCCSAASDAWRPITFSIHIKYDSGIPYTEITTSEMYKCELRYPNELLMTPFEMVGVSTKPWNRFLPKRNCRTIYINYFCNIHYQKLNKKRRDWVRRRRSRIWTSCWIIIKVGKTKPLHIKDDSSTHINTNASRILNPTSRRKSNSWSCLCKSVVLLRFMGERCHCLFQVYLN